MHVSRSSLVSKLHQYSPLLSIAPCILVLVNLSCPTPPGYTLPFPTPPRDAVDLSLARNALIKRILAA